MRRILLLGLVAALGLAGASIAVAHRADDKGTTAFTLGLTTTVNESRSRECTGVDGTYVHRALRATGTATGTVAGAAVLRLATTENTTEHLGVAAGTLSIRDAESDKLMLRAKVHGTVTGSDFNGWLSGKVVQDGKRGRLAANFTGTVGGNSVAINVGTAGANPGVIFGGAGCRKASGDDERRSGDDERKSGDRRTNDARGEITALTDTSITVKAENGDALTCTLTAEQKARLDREHVAVGDKAAVSCTSDGKVVAVKLGRR